MIRRIGEVVRFAAESCPLSVVAASVPFYSAVEKIAGVELDAGLVGENLQPPASRRLVDFSRERDFSIRRIENPIVIVAVAELELLIVGIDARADGGGFREVERCTSYGLQFACRNQSRIDWRKF